MGRRSGVITAYSGNTARQAAKMGRKAGSPPSRFWSRLVEALKERGEPTSQNAVAALLGMSHGSVWRWYHGDGLPTLDTCRDLAIKGGVSLDWLITGRKPKYPISKDPVLTKILQTCEDLQGPARGRILRIARDEPVRQGRA